MLYLLLTILSTVGLIVVFKYFDRFGVDTFQAIVSNYYVCVIIGYFFIDDEVLASVGITDLDKYSVVPGTTEFLLDFFID